MHHKRAKTKISQVKQVAQRQDKYAQHNNDKQKASGNKAPRTKSSVHLLTLLRFIKALTASAPQSQAQRQLIRKKANRSDNASIDLLQPLLKNSLD